MASIQRRAMGLLSAGQRLDDVTLEACDYEAIMAYAEGHVAIHGEPPSKDPRSPFYQHPDWKPPVPTLRIYVDGGYYVDVLKAPRVSSPPA